MFFFKLTADIFRYMAENSEPGEDKYKFKHDDEEKHKN
jgi:hypothetical protein